MSEDNSRNEYPVFSGEGFDVPKFLGDVLKFELDSKEYKHEDLFDADFRGMKLYQYLGLNSSQSLSETMRKLKKGIFAGYGLYERLAILYCFLGLDENSEPVKVLKKRAGEDIFPPEAPVEPYDYGTWNYNNKPKKRKIIMEKIVEDEMIPPNDKFGNFN